MHFLDCKTREAWLEERRNGIGGSDAGAILGVSPYKTPLSVYTDKTGLVPDEDVNEAMEWGNILEPVIRQRYEKETGESVYHQPFTIVKSAKHPWMYGSADGLIPSKKKVVEIKTAGVRSAHRWGTPGTDEIPEEYIAQVQHYLAVTEYASADVAVLIGGQEFRIYHVEADKELADMLIEAEWCFWDRNILQKIPPALTPPDEAAKYLAALHRNPHDKTLEFPDAPSWVLRLAAARAAAKLADENLTICENEAKALIGDAKGAKGLDWKINWTKCKDGFSTDYKEAVGEMLSVAGPETKTFIQAALAKHTKPKPGVRSFRCSGELFKSDETSA